MVDCVHAEAVITYLEKQDIKYLRGLVITHLHLDHYKEAVDFLNNCEREIGLTCERVLFNWPRRVPKSQFDQILRDPDGHSDILNNQKINENQRKTAYSDLKRWVDNHDNRYGALSRQFDIGSLQFNGSLDDVIELLHPRQSQLDDLILPNDESGVLKVRGLNSSALLMGDLEYRGWEYLNRKSVDLKSDVLKFPHHGAWRNADPALLLDEVNPSIIVISVGTSGTQYDHPNPHVFEAIAQRSHIRLLCTQVTEQCASQIPRKSKIVKQLFEENSTNDASNFYLEQSGCPCAGTIIIELGELPFVLQPNLKFHRDVIQSHFDTHKCII